MNHKGEKPRWREIHISFLAHSYRCRGILRASTCSCFALFCVCVWKNLRSKWAYLWLSSFDRIFLLCDSFFRSSGFWQMESRRLHTNKFVRYCWINGWNVFRTLSKAYNAHCYIRNSQMLFTRITWLCNVRRNFGDASICHFEPLWLLMSSMW